MKILGLDRTGMPRRWLTTQKAIEHYAKNHVIWELGEKIVVYRGGWNKDGVRSILETAPIIAIRGTEFNKQRRQQKVLLTNTSLFTRDQHLCAYCVSHFSNPKKLSRDHVLPVSRGGENTWNNCVTACVSCNTKKDNKTPEEAGMQLHYVPYEPNHYENLILKNKTILKDQMEYLLKGVPKESRVHKIVVN
jgi:5-methylcytosine-specific restriction endonuclease McrA